MTNNLILQITNYGIDIEAIKGEIIVCKLQKTTDHHDIDIKLDNIYTGLTNYRRDSLLTCPLYRLGRTSHTSDAVGDDVGNVSGSYSRFCRPQTFR